MNKILNGSPLIQYEKDLTIDDYTDKNKVDVDKLNGEINNGSIPDITSYDDLMEDPMDEFIDSSEIMAIQGNYEKTNFSSLFFSKDNMDALQKSIRYYVNLKTNKVISNQSQEELYIIMRSILFQNGDQAVIGKDNTYREIQKLNKLIIEFSVNTIVSQIGMHEKYVRDLENLQVPIDLPQYNNSQSIELGHPYV